MTQKETNPFAFSDSNKRYHTYEYDLKKRFGGRCAKILLDGGFSCPNHDGTCGVGGCIYCSDRHSGDFAPSPTLSIAEQFETQRAELRKKWPRERYIAYFQPGTNTYAPLARLKELYEQALALPFVVGLNIATRADCLPDEVIDYLAELSQRTVLTVELGLQSVHDQTARFINRGHTSEVFCDAFRRLRERAPRVRIGVHLILGLPHEDEGMMMESVKAVARLAPDEVKLHLLYVVRGTVLAAMYERGEYRPLEKEEYVALVVKALTYLPPKTVIGRLTGDGDRRSLLAPLWSCDKRRVLNEIDKLLYETQTVQGALFSSI